MAGLTKPIVFERDDKIYLVGPLAPLKPSEQDIEEYAYGKSIISDLRQQAPNEHIAWFGGHYVEADNPNMNGAMWTSDELSVKSLTPMFMPVTVMHDPRTAVGVIAHLALRTPEKDKVPRAKIETALALWRHRFPESVEEAEHNYANGTLMQSMECLAPDYECGECGQHFHKLPGGEERKLWCDHLKGETASAPTRILRSVVFTGTGLIYGSRGVEGADPNAHLESFQEEVAEFHSRSHSDRRSSSTRSTPRRKPQMDEMTIARTEYDRLVRERDDAVAAKSTTEEALRTAETEKAQAVKDLETTEAAKVAAETEVASLKTQITGFEEKASKDELASERLGALGSAFKAKLGEKTTERLTKQAAELSEEDWASRLDELEEITETKSDAKADGDEGTGDETASRKGGSEFSDDEVSRARVARRGAAEGQQTPELRSSVIGKLTRPAAAK